MTENKIKIFLADDHKMLRESLEILLSQEDDIEVVGEADDGIEAETLCLQRKADVLLLDISMPRKSGLDVCKNLSYSYPELKVIFLTMHKNEEMLAEAFNNGAKGYVLKENAFEELITAVRKVMDGEIYVSSVLAPVMLNGFLQNEKSNKELSGREREVLKLLAEGFSNKEIADFLMISVKTVETHRANIMRKHNFKNITELVLYAARNHLIEL
ncbi:response regulator [Aminipila luticellarii]|uniref:Stage 0 sporulation protein A homolog n=1 Tax=Aminipila luticellarii TaxID=2507160 RepID=A0A410PW13_9FIRM|nr:response regulator transcription factor [Aminipila luticellarii]QAT43117.1 response regulator transcription factor [Aminipila luticellarii]